MGSHGIRAGDWVEIEGVSGEVIEVGPLHTILLETGGWSDAGHPTGRKVAFVNSYAIEGHYFNFSTSGQWLWDEIQVPVPAGLDSRRVIEEIQKIVAAETEANAKKAEQEWHRAVLGRGGRGFSAAPSISVQPSSGGITIIARYITRAPEWRDVRSRMYGAIVDLLRREQNSPAPPENRGGQPLLAAAENK
jgi:small-conductance mechanosensitive channel